MRVPAVLFAACLALPAAAASGPSFDGESLRYTVNWPSGLSLGEAQMEARQVKVGVAGRWEFSLTLEAAVPGYSIREDHRSIAAPEFCSLEFRKQFTRGKRKADETVRFDPERRVAVRETTGGGKSEVPIPGCAKDALAFLYYLRSELRQGRLPGPQPVLFGAAYQVRLEYGGAQAVRVGDQRVEADRITASIKGPASALTLEIFFARDETRTPLVIRTPLALATFSMEVVR